MTTLDNEHELDSNADEAASSTTVRGFEEGAPPFSEASIIDLLQAEQRELAESREVYIPIKGYEGTGLQVCYHLPDSGKELDRIARNAQREHKDAYSRNITTAIDTMIHLCSGVYVQPTGVPEPAMLDPQSTGFPAQFDEKLAEILGMEGTSTARQVVRKLFGNNDQAILYHAEKLNRWLQNTKADLSLEVWQTGE